MSCNTPQITDAEAKRLWQRAAELQEEAERAAASRSLSAGGEEARLSLEHVTQAAEGVGISSDFVLLAMAEQQLPDALKIRRQDWRARWLRRTVSEADAIEVRQLLRGSPSAVQAAIRAVAAQPAYNLLLENTVGVSDEPIERVHVYRQQGGMAPFSSALNLADMRVLLITFKPVEGGTYIRVRAPLFRRGINLGLAGVTMTAVGLGGTWSGWALAGLVAGAVGTVAGSALLVPAGLGALAGGTIGLGGYRALYNRLVEQGTGALNTFLTSIALELESSSH